MFPAQQINLIFSWKTYSGIAWGSSQPLQWAGLAAPHRRRSISPGIQGSQRSIFFAGNFILFINGRFPTCKILLTCCIDRIRSSETKYLSLWLRQPTIWTFLRDFPTKEIRRLTVFLFQAVEFQFVCFMLCFLLQSATDQSWCNDLRYVAQTKWFNASDICAYWSLVLRPDIKEIYKEIKPASSASQLVLFLPWLCPEIGILNILGNKSVFNLNLNSHTCFPNCFWGKNDYDV